MEQLPHSGFDVAGSTKASSMVVDMAGRMCVCVRAHTSQIVPEQSVFALQHGSELRPLAALVTRTEGSSMCSRS